MLAKSNNIPPISAAPNRIVFPEARQPLRINSVKHSRILSFFFHVFAPFCRFHYIHFTMKLPLRKEKNIRYIKNKSIKTKKWYN